MSGENMGQRLALFCSYVPVEIIGAAGLKYERIIGKGNGTSSKIKAMFPTYMCSFAEQCMGEFIDNKKCFSCGVFTNSCHPMEGVYECMLELRGKADVTLVDVPMDDSEDSAMYFYSALRRFVSFLEEKYSVNITDDKLLGAIKKFNAKRQLRANLESLIMNKEVSLDSNEFMRLNQYYMTDDDAYDKLISEVIENKETRSNDKSLPRIMISGNTCTPMDIYGIVEEYGGKIVMSNNCNSYRMTPEYVDEDEDPLKALAKAYLHKPACARMNNLDKRLQEFEQYINDYKIDAVIFTVIKFCTDQSYWMVNVADMLRKKNIPFMFADMDFSSNGSGQIHTRIQAFLEQL